MIEAGGSKYWYQSGLSSAVSHVVFFFFFQFLVSVTDPGGWSRFGVSRMCCNCEVLAEGGVALCPAAPCPGVAGLFWYGAPKSGPGAPVWSHKRDKSV